MNDLTASAISAASGTIRLGQASRCSIARHAIVITDNPALDDIDTSALTTVSGSYTVENNKLALGLIGPRA